MHVGHTSSSVHLVARFHRLQDLWSATTRWVFARKLLNDWADIKGSYYVKKASTLFIDVLNAIQARRHLDDWAAPQGLSPMQRFPNHTLNFVSAVHKDYTVSRHCCTFPYKKWYPRYRMIFNQMDPVVLMAYELTTLYLELCPSINTGRWLGIFAAKQFCKGETIGSNYDSLIYDNVWFGSSKLSTVYGEGMIAVSSSEFHKWSLQLNNIIPCSHNVCIYPAPFGIFKMVNYAHYTKKERGRPTDIELKNNQESYRRNNVEVFGWLKIEPLCSPIS